MLEFMLRAFNDFNAFTDYLRDEYAEPSPEQLFTSELILKRRDQYKDLIFEMSEAGDD